MKCCGGVLTTSRQAPRLTAGEQWTILYSSATVSCWAAGSQLSNIASRYNAVFPSPPQPYFTPKRSIVGAVLCGWVGILPTEFFIIPCDSTEQALKVIRYLPEEVPIPVQSQSANLPCTPYTAAGWSGAGCSLIPPLLRPINVAAQENFL